MNEEFISAVLIESFLIKLEIYLLLLKAICNIIKIDFLVTETSLQVKLKLIKKER